MVKVNNKQDTLQLAAGLLPLGLSLGTIFGHSWLPLIFCALSLFLIVRLLPICRRRENLSMFLLVAIAGLPLNAYLIWYAFRIELFVSELMACNVITAFIAFCMLFSIEEIVFGVITRFIWKRQYKINI